MAYITQMFKKSKKQKLSEQELMLRSNDRIFIFTVVLAVIVMAVDYALLIKFIDIIKNLQLGDVL